MWLVRSNTKNNNYTPWALPWNIFRCVGKLTPPVVHWTHLKTNGSPLPLANTLPSTAVLSNQNHTHTKNYPLPEWCCRILLICCVKPHLLPPSLPPPPSNNFAVQCQPPLVLYVLQATSVPCFLVHVYSCNVPSLSPYLFLGVILAICFLIFNMIPPLLSSPRCVFSPLVSWSLAISYCVCRLPLPHFHLAMNPPSPSPLYLSSTLVVSLALALVLPPPLWDSQPSCFPACLLVIFSSCIHVSWGWPSLSMLSSDLCLLVPWSLSCSLAASLWNACSLSFFFPWPVPLHLSLSLSIYSIYTYMFSLYKYICI